MSQKVPKCTTLREFFFGLWDGAEANTRVFERIFHDDKWTGCGRSWLAKWENFAAPSNEERRFSYIYVWWVKVLVGFSGIGGFFRRVFWAAREIMKFMPLLSAAAFGDQAALVFRRTNLSHAKVSIDRNT
jgi:hypothetical protein